jgi:hypothetical protein
VRDGEAREDAPPNPSYRWRIGLLTIIESVHPDFFKEEIINEEREARQKVGGALYYHEYRIRIAEKYSSKIL